MVLKSGVKKKKGEERKYWVEFIPKSSYVQFESRVYGFMYFATILEMQRVLFL